MTQSGLVLPSGVSSASLRIAVKSLFRHLHEPRALRRNPLVRHFFDGATGAAGRARERTALDSIHTLVRQAAAACRDSDIEDGKEERASLQYSIVAQLLDGLAMPAIATAIGISLQYCYRQRGEIGSRVACYIRENYSPAALNALPEPDEFRLLMDRVKHSASNETAEAAFARCDELIRSAPSTPQRIEALRVSAVIAMQFDDAKRAENNYAQAVAAVASRPSALESLAWRGAEACIDLVGSKLANWQRSAIEALRLAQRATVRLESIDHDAPEHLRELYAESLYQLGAAFCNLGSLEKGYDCFARAEAALCRLRTASGRLRVRVMVGIWQLRNHLVTNSKSWRPAWQRVHGLTTAFQQAYSAGFLLEGIDALAGLVEYHASCGNYEDALRAADLAVLLARQQPSDQIRSQTGLKVAMHLIATPHWEKALSLLPAGEQLRGLDAYSRALISQFPAELALRRHEFRDAWTLTQNERDHASFPFLLVGSQIVAAAAANELDRRQDARGLIESAVAAAERLGSVPTLRDVYRVAAKVTRDQRFKRRARELERMLTA